MMKRIALLLLLLWGCFTVPRAQAVRYTEADSLWIEQLLHDSLLYSADNPGGQVLSVAYRFLDCPYVAGTLETDGAHEQLIVNTRQLDCTTFVETVTALVLTLRSSTPTFSAFVAQLQKIRYRKGIIHGYPSRLHYFSDWIAENQRAGRVHERQPDVSSVNGWLQRPLKLSYMSTHPESYPALKENEQAVRQIRAVEQQYASASVWYLPKNRLAKPPNTLPIQEGDILALVTNVDGLDVSHVGFAVWCGEELHLLHASTKSGKVMLDSQSLYSYMQGRKSQLGVRAITLP